MHRGYVQRVQGFHHLYQVSRLSLYGHTGVLGSGRPPLAQARGASLCYPFDQCDMHSRPDPGPLPQDHPRNGVVALWLPPGQLHGIISEVAGYTRGNTPA